MLECIIESFLAVVSLGEVKLLFILLIFSNKNVILEYEFSSFVTNNDFCFHILIFQ